MTIAALLLFIRTLGLTLPLWIVAGWSAAEAAIFFIVADVPISWIAVRSGTKAAVLAALVAAVASVVGVLLLWWWSANEPLMPTAVMTLLPGIDGTTLSIAGDIYSEGYLAVLAASFQGIPFKLFALEAGPSLPFLLLAPLLRLPRFLAIALFVGAISKFLESWMSVRQRLALLIVLWVAFYTWYFSVMPR
jgi:hypothetical protein